MDIIFIFIIVILIFLASEGVLGRKRLHNARQAHPLATIERIEPKKYGSKSSRHFEIKIYFSDGTSYRDKCNEDSYHFLYKTYRISKEQFPVVVQNAILAHQKAANKNLKRNRSVPLPDLLIDLPNESNTKTYREMGNREKFPDLTSFNSSHVLKPMRRYDSMSAIEKTRQ